MKKKKAVKKKSARKLRTSDVEQLVENWQRCPAADLPDMFMAYRKKTAVAERVASYRMPAGGTAALVAELKKQTGDYQLVVRLGLTSPTDSGESGYTDTPRFVLLLQILPEGSSPESLKRCFSLSWNPDENFEGKAFEETGSGIDAIPGAGAYLFVYAWKETAQDYIAATFANQIDDPAQRVVCYTYSTQESMIVGSKLMKWSGDSEVKIHLGSSFAVHQHPYCFRPILTITRGATAAANDDGDGEQMFDFGHPQPPY